MNHSSTFYGNSDRQREDRVSQYIDMGLIPITNDPIMFQEALSQMGSGASSSNTSHRQREQQQRRQLSSSRIVIRPSNSQIDWSQPDDQRFPRPHVWSRDLVLKKMITVDE
ncbi:MAG: hypothetical protein R3B67_10570 [Phycisphaerales bacterium]